MIDKKIGFSLVIILEQFSITHGVDLLGKVRKLGDSTANSLKVIAKNRGWAFRV